MTLVVDSSALLALVKAEPGGRMVAEALPSAIASAVIFAESVSKAANQGYDPDQVASQLRADGLTVHPVNAETVSSVVRLHRLAARGISLADRFCLALALDLGAAVLTADRPWAALGLPVELRFIR